MGVWGKWEKFTPSQPSRLCHNRLVYPEIYSESFMQAVLGSRGPFYRSGLVHI